MKLKNGICYPDVQSEQLKILKATASGNDIELLFSTGETKTFNISSLTGPVFEGLNNDTMKVENGVVTWLDGELDCAPEFMYRNSK